MFMTVVLIFSSFVIPYRMAFIAPENETTTWNIINYLIDSTFFMDIIVTFNTAFYDENFKIVEDRGSIAKGAAIDPAYIPASCGPEGA